MIKVVKLETSSAVLARLCHFALTTVLLLGISACSLGEHEGVKGRMGGDRDGDGVADVDDNCPTTPNPGQADTDRDRFGDACDNSPNGDDDGDGIDNAADNCPAVANPSQANSDNDAAGDACDDDRDNDGVADAADNCPDIANPAQTDSTGNGIGDACDLGSGPVANAGPDQQVIEGSIVVLDGSASRDAGATQGLSFEWSGPLSLSDASIPQPSFVAPEVDGLQVFSFELVVRNSSGEVSASDAVNVTVTDDPAAFVLQWPLEAVHGSDYTVTSYFDTDRAEGTVADHQGGQRAFDQQVVAIDARFVSRRKLNESFAVFPVAAGTVVFKFDELSDELGLQCDDGPRINRVILEHVAGYYSQYTLLRQNSAMVELGDRVTTTSPLGLIGSGACEFDDPGIRVTVFQTDLEPEEFLSSGDFLSFAINPWALGLWAQSGRMPPPYDGPATILDFIVENDGTDENPRADFIDAPDQNIDSAQIGDEISQGVFVGGGLPGESLVFRATTGGMERGDSPVCDLAPTDSGPFSPRLCDFSQVADVPGEWIIEVVLNGAVVASHTFDVGLGFP